MFLKATKNVKTKAVSTSHEEGPGESPLLQGLLDLVASDGQPCDVDKVLNKDTYWTRSLFLLKAANT